MNGDSEFEDLVQAWYDPLYRFAYSLTGRRGDALDLTQNTFLKWARKRQTVRKRHKAKSWLFTVLYREISEILDVPIGTVMSRIRRGKDRLKQQLETSAERGKTVVPFSRKQAES